MLADLCQVSVLGSFFKDNQETQILRSGWQRKVLNAYDFLSSNVPVHVLTPVKLKIQSLNTWKLLNFR